MQKIWMLQCLCTSCLNTARISQKQQEACGIITEMNQIVVQITTNYSIKDSKSFDYKTSITGKLEGNNTEKKSKLLCN